MPADRTAVQAYTSDLENLWWGIDEIFSSLGPADWARPHGPDWTFADPPYHLSYFDREIVARAIERGPNVPKEEQKVWRNFNDVNAWNAQMFELRPPGQTAQESCEQMRASRDYISRVVRSMTDADLERPVFVPVFGGWLNAGAALQACRAHTWNHHTELRLRLGRTSPAPSDSASRGALAFYSMLIPHISLDRQQAANRDFTMVWDFTGSGGGTWSVSVNKGACACTEGAARPSDVTMKQSPESFVKTLTGMHDPAQAIQSGEIGVDGMENMETYAALFPPLDPARDIPPMGKLTL